MSILKDAIKTITTEGTKKRYWPSKNPIDDPSDFPGEKNYEEEAEVTDPSVQHNMFHVKPIRDAVLKRIQEIDREAGWTPEAEWLDWLHTVLGDYDQDSHGKESITRPEFAKLLQHWRINTKTRHPSDGWGELNIQKVLDDSIGKAGGKELYADNIGAYGKPQGEEGEEDYDPMDDGDYAYDNWKDRQHEKHEAAREKEHRRVSQPGAPENDTSDSMRRGGTPNAIANDGYENEETTDCQMCGNTGYSMSDGKPCRKCEQGKAEMEKQIRHIPALSGGGVENEEQDDCQMCGNTGYYTKGQPCPNCYRGEAERRSMAQEDRLGHNDPDRGNEENEEAMPTMKYAKTFKQWLPTK